MSTQPRQPIGTPSGGQYASKGHGEADMALDEPGGVGDQATPEAIGSGRWSLIDATTRTKPAPFGMEGMEIRPAGFPSVRSATAMVALRTERSLQVDAVHAKLDHLAATDSKATVLLRRRNGEVEIVEGTLLKPSGSEGVAIIPKGRRSNGEWLIPESGDPQRSPVAVLAVEPGYGHVDQLAGTWNDQAAKCPRLEDATFDDIPVWDGKGEPPRDIAAAYVIEHPGFGGGEDGRGVVLFVTDRQPDPDDAGASILNGYMVVPPGSGMESEHGSMYQRDVAGRGGRVAGFASGSMTFRDAMALGDSARSHTRPDGEGGWTDAEGDIEATWEALRGASG